VSEIKATMILYLGGDQLEFADGDGKSLGKIAHPRAAQVFQNIASTHPSVDRVKMITNIYRQFKPTPAGHPAGFERKGTTS